MTTRGARWLLSCLATALLAAGCAPPEPVDLEQAEASVFSQNGEDGVIEKIFELIEPSSRFAVEFGASDGVRNSNVRNLIVNEDWGALMMEGDPERAARCAEAYEDSPKASCIQAWIYPGNVELLFEENGVPRNLDLLVIDIDSNDWYVWRAIRDFRPKVVLIEYNAFFAPPVRMVIDFHPLNYWDGSAYFGASIQSLYELGKEKGYELLYADKHGINLFFVEARFYRRFGVRDNSPEKLYRPYGGVRALTPAGVLSILRNDGKLPPPHDEPLVWDEVTIEKHFLIDQR